MSAMKSSSSLMYCLMHSMAAVVHCGGRKATQIIHEGRITLGSRRCVAQHRVAPRCFTGPVLITTPTHSDVEPYPRQRRDHVLLDDGGFSQPRADVCANKLRGRPSVKLPVTLLTGFSRFLLFTWTSSSKLVSGRGDLNLRACRSSSTTMRDM